MRTINKAFLHLAFFWQVSSKILDIAGVKTVRVGLGVVLSKTPNPCVALRFSCRQPLWSKDNQSKRTNTTDSSAHCPTCPDEDLRGRLAGHP